MPPLRGPLRYSAKRAGPELAPQKDAGLRHAGPDTSRFACVARRHRRGPDVKSEKQNDSVLSALACASRATPAMFLTLLLT